MTREIRFEVSKEIQERHERLVKLLSRGTGELARSLYISALEQMEKNLMEGKFPVFTPVPNLKQLKFKYVDKDLIS